MKILVTGGCGYKGHILIPKLLSEGHVVVAFDIQWFGNFLEPHLNLIVVKGDVRNIDEVPLDGVECIIHLASIANDPCGDLNPKLTWEVSALATMQLADKANRVGVKRFIYASSGSVYGVKDEPEVTEDMSLEPLTDYSKYKAKCEEELLRVADDDFIVSIIRPSTVCGYSPRMRLDLTVNILTNLAVNKGEITVFGGEQMRPNIHIEDMTDLYVFLLELPDGKVHKTVYNVGYQNFKVKDIAEMVKKIIGPQVNIKTTSTDDNRSYHVSSRKIKAELGFESKHSVEDAIRDLKKAFGDGKLPFSLDDVRYFNIKTMQALNMK